MLTDIYKIPIGASLGVVAGILALAVVASLVVSGREAVPGRETPRG
jgi:hypothetical protein